MKQKRFLGMYCLGAMFAVALFGSSSVWARNSFSLPTANVFVSSTVDLNLTVDADDDIQGLIVAAALADGSIGDFTNVDVGPLTSGSGPASLGDGADQVVSTIVGGDAFVIGAVFDLNTLDNGGNPEVLSAGSSSVIAVITFQAGSTDSVSSAVDFVDGVYSADGAQVGPAQVNIVVVGGMSFDSSEGLALNGGRLNVLPVPPGTYNVESDMGGPGDNNACVDVTLESGEGVQGFVVALGHDAKVSLASIPFPVTGSLIDGGAAEFVDKDIFANGGVVSVIMDFDAPYNNQTIDGIGGDRNVIATFCYDVVDDPDDRSDCDAEPPVEGSNTVADLTFIDFVLDNPAKENVSVINGTSNNVLLNHGTITFKAEPCVECVREHTFACGGELVSAQRCSDDNGSGGFALEGGGFNTDPSTPSNSGAPGPLSGKQGESVSVCFYYTSPPTGTVDESDPENQALDQDDIQGLSISAYYDEGLKCLNTWTVENTITEAVGADFINVDCQDDGPNGGGRLIVGILVDFLPPFDGQTLPPTLDFLKIICVDFQVSDDIPCDSVLCINFRDCSDSTEKPCIKNLISAMNQAISPRTFPCCVTVRYEPDFTRGDCNFSAEPGMENMSVDISDPAAVISHLFLTGTWKFEPPCLDACDCNDDGRIDLADAVCILTFLFSNPNGSDLPSPGAMWSGPDETEDKLNCAGNESCPDSPQ